MTPSNAPPTFVLIPGLGCDVVSVDPGGPRACPAGAPRPAHRTARLHGFDALFPAGYQCPQDPELLARAPSLVAELTLDDYITHTLQIVRRVADHSSVSWSGTAWAVTP
jgi:hypothetical protein